MNAYVLPPPPTIAVPVSGNGALFPVRRVYCVGRNYAAHAREMGFSDREPPFFFCKPADAIVAVREGTMAEIPYPARTADFQHEIELVVAIGRRGSDIPADDALDHVFGYAVGLDMTRRDLQIRMREQGRPAVGDRKILRRLGDRRRNQARCRHRASRAGTHPRRRGWPESPGQRYRPAHMERRRDDRAPVRLVRAASGDLIYTGTPAGVGPVHVGQTMTGVVEGLGELRVRIG